jgi:hypothetical protein
MTNPWLDWLCGGVLAAAGLAAQAEGPAAERCSAPAHDGPLLADRQERIAQYEALGDQCLKRLLLACDDAANRHLLDSGSAFACSIGYEALLRRGFGGDFQAMLGWWRNWRERPETLD